MVIGLFTNFQPNKLMATYINVLHILIILITCYIVMVTLLLQNTLEGELSKVQGELLGAYKVVDRLEKC